MVEQYNNINTPMVLLSGFSGDFECHNGTSGVLNFYCPNVHSLKIRVGNIIHTCSIVTYSNGTKVTFDFVL